MLEGTWAIVEMLGHRQAVGQLSEVTVAGATMLRVETPGEPPRVVLVAASALYAITPCTEEYARQRVAPRLSLGAGFGDDDDYDDDDA
jgi:NaMN:DMB phosphoribosyltransferase